LQKLAIGDKENAEKHLLIASHCPAPGWWITTMSKAYLSLIRQGRLPVEARESQQQ
jgi:hypothetical protein